MRIFLDSSVFFSAAYSPRGHSRDLLLKAAREEITAVISRLVVEETRRNLAESVPEYVQLFDLNVEAIPFEYLHPTRREVIEAARIIALKDAPILAAAKKARVDFLATLDRKHLLDRQELADFVGGKIAAPKDIVTFIQGSS